MVAGGLLVAAVIKYGDNILKNFTTACSVILGTLVSVVLFDFKLTMQFAWGSALVVASAYAYGVAPSAEAPKVAPEDADKVPTESKPLTEAKGSDSGDEKA